MMLTLEGTGLGLDKEESEVVWPNAEQQSSRRRVNEKSRIY